MPIYEYRCSACSHELEALQKVSAPALVDCPSCGRADLVKLISAAGFHLKGTGWYATDFKSGSKPAATAEKSAEAKPAEAKSETPSAAPACGAGGCAACQ